MDQKKEKKFIVDILFVLALFGVFAFSALVLVVIGADVYQHTVNDMRRNSDSRVTTSYLAGKLRQYDRLAGGEIAFSAGKLDGTPALVLTTRVNDTSYNTYLYCHEDCLKELTMRQGTSLGGNAVDAGQEIMKLRDFTVEQTAENLFTIRVTTADGEESRLLLSSHCTAD